MIGGDGLPSSSSVSAFSGVVLGIASASSVCGTGAGGEDDGLLSSQLRFPCIPFASSSS